MNITLLFGTALLLASMFVHASTFITDREPLPMAVVFPLTGLMFILFFIAVRVARKQDMHVNGGWSWKQVLEHAPKWTHYALAALAAYTGFNFLFSLWYLNEGLTPGVVQGQYVMQDHGNVVRTLSQAEYWRHSAYELRGMSTHIILFTAVALGMLWSHVRKEKYLG
ncbi:MAG: hypothetical protein JNL52_11420 [Flavobacteriales bacterium]|nr:hypothetical protein [Flavobacteriales bacterium]